MLGWCADFLRCAWSFLYWNARKSVFRLGNRSGPAPCQNASDSGRAHETGCDACLHWHQPRRFRCVCPLLVPAAAGGYCCSVDHKDVRPFWIRAGLALTASAVVTYVCLVLLVFAFLRIRGYEISPRQLAWPPAWNELRGAQARLFFQKGSAALSEGRINEAVLSLSIAYEQDPRNDTAGRLLAQLWQITQPTLSDRIYAQLLRTHPERYAETAQLWYRALLNRGDFSQLASVALAAIPKDPAHQIPWTRAFLFASRFLATAAPLEQAIASEIPLSDDVRTVIRAELELRIAVLDDERKALLRPTDDLPDSPLLVLHKVESLLRCGLAPDALALLDKAGDVLDPQTQAALRLEGFAIQPWTSRRRDELSALLGPRPGAPSIELISAHLIRHPDPELAEGFFKQVEASPLAQTPENIPAIAALFCVAGAYRDQPRLNRFRKDLENLSGGAFAGVARLEAFFLGRSDDPRLGASLPVLPVVPIEVAWALFSRQSGEIPAPQPAPQSRRP